MTSALRALARLVGAAAVAAAVVLVAPSSARAGDGALTGDLSRLDEHEIERRYAFIRERLDQGKRGAQLWQYGFTSAWGFGVAVGAAQASTTDNKVTRISGIVTSTKAAGGVAKLLWSPHPARHGAEDLEGLPSETREERIERLAAAEALLREVEIRAESRLGWKRHAYNVAANLVGGAVIVGVGGFDRAWDNALTSFGVGVVAGEVMVFAEPSRGADDAADYRRRFVEMPRNPEVSWRLVPKHDGFAFQVEF